jgi:hypothetical protein
VLAHDIAFGLDTPLPKTGGTIELLTRQLMTLADLPKVEDPESSADNSAPPPPPQPGDRGDFRRNRQERMVAARETDIELRSRSAGWILGTSCAFEAVVLGMAAWIFCRRDY